MGSHAGSKRTWENEDTISVSSKRRSSTLTAASLAQQVSPLPPQAGLYAQDSLALDHRVLPPLLASYDISASPVTISSTQYSLPAPLELLRGPQRRSYSLFDIFDHRPMQSAHRHHTEPSTIHSRAPQPVATSPHSKPVVHSDSVPRPVPVIQPEACCPPHCEGQICSNSRLLVHKLVTALDELVDRLEGLTHIEQQVAYKPPVPGHAKIEDALQWALDRLHEGKVRLHEHIEQRPPHNIRSPSPTDDSPNMRRTQHYLEEREEQSSPRRQHPAQINYGHFNTLPDDPRRLPHSIAATMADSSPQRISTPSGAMYMPPQSPIQSAMLPSPSSLNLSSSQSLPSMTPPITAAHPSAHNTLLQDLQHQVTVKTLEFRTLQREYENLLQKLERQKTKCATLEKKFEVSDVEINCLTEEKEKLQTQIAAMEGQVEELQQSRDEARRQLIANGAQYMRIMEMANRLQSQGAEDKKKWEAEKMELKERIRVLEEAMVTGGQHHTTTSGLQHQANVGSALRPIEPPPNACAASSPSQIETINVLRGEIGRLRARTQTLESAVRTMRQESISIQTAARQLMDSSEKVKGAAQDILGECA